MTGLTIDTNSSIPLKLSSETIEKLRTSPFDQGSLFSKIFDKISDYFCGTHRVEAKDLLRELFKFQMGYEPPEGVAKDDHLIHMMTKFNRLESLAGESFKGNFEVLIDDAFDLTLKIQIKDDDGKIIFDPSMQFDSKELMSDAFNSFQSDSPFSPLPSVMYIEETF